VWRLYRPLGGLFPVTAAKGPRHNHRRGIGGIVYACSAPAVRIVVIPAGVTILLGLHNPPCS
jgi:hypothetical protein